MDSWGPAGVISAAVLAAAGLLWKIRRDEIDELKVSIATSINANMAGLIASFTEQIKTLRDEVDRLREWRHDFGPKEMVISDHDRRIENLERRVYGRTEG